MNLIFEINDELKMRIALLMMMVSVASGLVCRTLDDDPIDGFHLWQRNDAFFCHNNETWKIDNYTCVIGNVTPPKMINEYSLTFQNLKLNNRIQCQTHENDTWEMKDIDMDPRNEVTFEEASENQFMVFCINYWRDFKIFVSGQEIFHLLVNRQFERNKNYAIAQNTFIRQFNIFKWGTDHQWIRIYFTPIQPFHAGVWSVEIGSKPYVWKNLFYVNVKSNLTCSDNILTTTCDVEEIPSTTELSCRVGWTFNQTSFENIVCKIRNEILIPINEFNFRIDPSEHKGSVIECVSDQSNQTWTSNPIKYFQRIENVTKATIVSSSRKQDCSYLWITPTRKIIPGRHLHSYLMTEFGTYCGMITCDDKCPFIDRVIHFNNPYTTMSKIESTPTMRKIESTSTTIESTPSNIESMKLSFEIQSKFYKDVTIYILTGMVVFLIVFFTTAFYMLNRLKVRYIPVSQV